MGEIITLTDDIDGPSVVADERIRFTVDKREHEIDLTTEHAAELRQVFDVFTTTVKVRASIDGVEHEAHLPALIAEDFNLAIGYWTEHARTKGTQAPRIGHPAQSRSTGRHPGPAIQPGKKYWETPSGLGHGTIAAKPWRDLRREIKEWSAAQNHPISDTGPIPEATGYAFALMRQGKPWTLGPDVEAGEGAEAAEDAEAALMPEPARTTTSKTRGKRK